jgi:hypothetical protein
MASLTNTRGIFTLSDVRVRQNTGNWQSTLFGNFGYFNGSGTRIERIDYSNDTAIASVRGPLILTRQAATSNSSYGWFGASPSPVLDPNSEVERIDYSNDTATTSVRGPLSQSRSGLAATGNSDYGWFGGGFKQNTTSTPVTFTYYARVDRIDYSNDTVTASVRGSLTRALVGPAATGNSSFGYFGGGSDGNVPFPYVFYSLVSRITYSNDTVTASPRGPLTLARSNAGATGNSSYGWFGGGTTSTPSLTSFYSRVDRIDYSNDTTTASARGPLTSNKSGAGANGNSSYGWFGGGSAGVTLSTIDRIDFSNDNVTASQRGNLNFTGGTISTSALNIRLINNPLQVLP